MINWDFINPLSRTYLIGYWLSRAPYALGLRKSQPAPIDTICVGNLYVGGSGKTPVAMAIIQQQLDQGRRVGYLSRGYGRKTRGPLRVDHHIAQSAEGWKQYGDETCVVARQFPNIQLVVAERRLKGYRLFDQVDIVIMDDGMQHWAIQPQHMTVCVPAGVWPAQQSLLPTGRLREPHHQIQRADSVMVTRWTHGCGGIDDAKDALAQSGWHGPVHLMIESVGETAWPQGDYAALAGLAQSNRAIDRWEDQIGRRATKRLALSDHQAISMSSWRNLTRNGEMPLVLSAKDAVKLPQKALEAQNHIVVQHQANWRDEPPHKW